MPKVTVAIPAYNHGKFLRRAIDSVYDQSFRDFELFVFDNGSIDDTRDVATSYNDLPALYPNFHYTRHPENMGGTYNWNCCLRAGDGEYIAILHADDEFMPEHLSRMVEMLDAHPECGLCYCPAWWIDADDKIITLMNHPGHKPASYAGGRNEMADLLIYDCYVTPSSVVYRREAVRTVGEFVEGVSGDWDYVVRFGARYPFAFDKEPTIRYRWHAEQGSHRYYASADPVRSHIQILLSAYKAHPEKFEGFEKDILRFLLARLSQYQIA